LAQHQMSLEQELHPVATYHRITEAQLQSTAPSVDWTTLFKDTGVDPAIVDVQQPDYLTGLSELIRTLPAAQIKAYLRWQLLNDYAYTLPRKIRESTSTFYYTTLEGGAPPSDRSWQCAFSTDGALTDALSQAYQGDVELSSSKADVVEIAQTIKNVLREHVAEATWMTGPTKAQALAKVEALQVHVAYPDRWRDYSDLPIAKGPYAENAIASSLFDNRADYAKIGKPTNPNSWMMSATSANAYYDTMQNAIYIPAGLLQPPYFSVGADMAANFGAIGSVIGHEMTHGFDQEGRRFDASGNLRDWWSNEDTTQFEARAQCIVDQFNQLSPTAGVQENGKLVEGEAIADLGGATIAYDAFERWQATHPRLILDGFTPEQRFFIAWAQMWASNEAPKYTTVLARTDTHPYPKFRVNATVENMPEFARAWGCKLPDPMTRDPASQCRVW
jgi:putative endopeptidase